VTVESFDRVGGLDHAADAGEGREERDHEPPGVKPRLGDDPEPGALLLVEALQFRSAAVAPSAVWIGFTSRANLLASRRRAYFSHWRMSDAGPDGCSCEDRIDRIGEAFGPSTQQSRMSATPRC
jgi:hypothetical protein